MAQAALTSSSSSSSSSGSDSETSTRRHLKRKFDTNSDSDSDSSSSSSDSEAGSSSKIKKKKKALKKKEGIQKPDNVDAEEEEDIEEDVQVLSHKEQRKLKKKQKLAESEPAGTTDSSSTKAAQKSKTKGKDKDEKPARKNSVWVGNLSFRTNPDALKTFFAEAGEVTRVHMPTKAIHGTNVEGAKRGENRGFAYVDFTTPEAKVIAITMSEKNLDGRRLLIKDGDDFSGRPAVASAATADANGSTVAPGPSSGLSKTAQKILSRQKQPACPCLFLGNLGFEATQESVREMFERNAKSRDRWAQKDKSEKGKGKGKRGKGKDADLEDEVEGEGEDTQDAAAEGSGEGEERKGSGVRKVRLGTFEDSGNCKGFGFVDFATAAEATAALINPYNHSLDGRSLVVEYASLDAARRGGYRPPNPDGESGGRKAGHNPKGAGGRKFKENATDRAKPLHSSAFKSDRAHKEVSNGAEADGDAFSEDKAYRKRKTGDDGHGDAYHSSERPAKKAHANSDWSRDRGAGEAWANAKHRRAKPGAALAMAQREKVAIVPSTGTRLTFT